MGNRQGVDDSPLSNVKVMKGLKLASLTLTLAADNYAITVDHPPVLFIDPDGSKDVLLPAIDENSAGLTFFVFSSAGTATEVITFKTSADGVISPAIAIIGDEGVMITNNGIAWRGVVGSYT
jgi:hypothetical protein